MTKTAQFFDLFDNEKTYTVLEYATKIGGNVFDSNFSGMKGTALQVSGVSELQVHENTFSKNRPVTSFIEKEYSPYFKYVALEKRAIVMNAAECA